MWCEIRHGWSSTPVTQLDQQDVSCFVIRSVGAVIWSVKPFSGCIRNHICLVAVLQRIVQLNINAILPPLFFSLTSLAPNFHASSSTNNQPGLPYWLTFPLIYPVLLSILQQQLELGSYHPIDINPTTEPSIPAIYLSQEDRLPIAITISNVPLIFSPCASGCL